jgi:HPt (histidine-containing phosphotransfer) domain-containing protein
MQVKSLDFIYSGKLDASYLFELYQGDVYTTLEVFESSLLELNSELQLAETLFNKCDLRRLQFLYHKLSPLLGYMGLPKLQKQVQQFEEFCKRSQSTAEISSQFVYINILIAEAMVVVRQELIRLKKFINKRA